MHVNKDNARSDDQRQELERIKEGDFCPFCSKEYMENEHPHPVILENEHWFATKNRWPNENARVHLLIVHKDHIEHMKDIRPEARLSLLDIVEKLTEKLELPGATLIMRYGDGKFTGSTVSHLHAQLFSGHGEKDSKPVLTRVG